MPSRIRVRPILAVIATTLLIPTVAAPVALAAEPPATGATWTVTDIPAEYGNLVSVDAAAGAVVATGFGIDDDFNFSPLAVSWDGEEWVNQPVKGHLSNSYARLDDVALTSPKRGWAVGTSDSSPIAAKWNGKRWKASVLDFDGLLSLHGVDTVGKTVWAVGQDQGESAVVPLLLRHDQNGWTRVKTPKLHDVDLFQSLTSVAAIARDDVWAVGTGGIALHYNGKKWSQVSVPKVDGEFVEFNAVREVAPGEVWGVGEIIYSTGARHPVALRWAEDAWQIVQTPPDFAQLNDVTRTADGRTVAIGYSEDGALAFYGLRLDPNGPAKSFKLPPGHDALFGAARDPGSSDLWVVGSGAVGDQGFIGPYAAVRR